MNDELDRYLNRGLYFAQEVKERYPLAWSAVGEAVARSNDVMHRIIASCASQSQQDLRARVGLWGSVRRYQIASILEIFSRNLDEGVAILRMATELAKTLKAISARPEFFSEWARGECSSEFKKLARLDPSDPLERTVFAAWEFCSKYGTHGNKTNAAYLEDTPTGKEPSLSGVAEIAKGWFVYYTPIHRFCLKRSIDSSSDLFVECDVALTLIEAKLLERILKDPFFSLSPRT